MPVMERRSEKRDAILSTIRSTTCHPSAEWVLKMLKPIYPDLSLGTVYRNLSRFKESGMVQSVGVVNGQERFDGNPLPHTHFICTRCGAVIDVESLSPDVDLTRKAEEQGFQVDSCELVFHGRCPACRDLWQ